MVVAVSSDAKGLYALGILSQEASIIAAKERAQMKMIEFFIPTKLLLLLFTAALNHIAPYAVKRAGIVLIVRMTQSFRKWGDPHDSAPLRLAACNRLFFTSPYRGDPCAIWTFLCGFP